MQTKVKVVPVIETMPADLFTPLSVYLKLAKTSQYSFLLESVEGGEALARYSFIGADPETIVSGNDNEVQIISDGDATHLEKPFFEFLREHFADVTVRSEEELPPFVGGAIGYLGFECSAWFEPSLKKQGADEEPEATFMFFRSIIAFDHVKQVVKIITLIFHRGDDAGSLEDQLSRASQRNSDIRHILETQAVELPVNATADLNAVVASNRTKGEFEDAVRQIKELIRAGECYQVVMSQCFSRRTSAHPISIYRAMRSLNPSPYMFLLATPDRTVVGGSPEMLVKCSGSDLEYRPIAGTRRRGKTADEDRRLAEEMRADAKEVAEHLMLVDLGRNDLGRVAEYGTVTVDDLMNVEKYSHVQHLVSYLSAKLRPGFDRFDALASCFPAGTVSGAPKVRAIEIIRSLEPDPRGVYAGAVGYFDYGGNMDTCIAIRTMVLKDGVAYVQAGAGIVADSVPELEYEETVNKARALLKAIELAEAQKL